ncbi:hypothetical protein E1B28_005436 [Marasmius oreades]|uniref:Uncharacterized protein n=1 Tax=Marasmius oreades TaxID=181124 RepID=A0A9P7S3V1_9AGAR|nr:uncharacterized protein E1B28_005436 [Marasmius oreades]KAG7094612.1 hypothetical protein E1B28_005436 [Marasmius oreades]
MQVNYLSNVLLASVSLMAPSDEVCGLLALYSLDVLNLILFLWSTGSSEPPPEPSELSGGIMAVLGDNANVLGHLIGQFFLTGVNFLSAIYLAEGEIPLEKMGHFGALVIILLDFMVRKPGKKTSKGKEETIRMV